MLAVRHPPVEDRFLYRNHTVLAGILVLLFQGRKRGPRLKPKTEGEIRVFAVGDVIGRPGRNILRTAIPILHKTYDWDALVVNVENAAGGFGLTPEVFAEFRKMPIDCMTSGNHIFDKKGYKEWMGDAPGLLRPLNLPSGSIGRGALTVTLNNGLQLGVINIMGRTFMKPYDCPFRAVDKAVAELRQQTPLILVDFHAEATSEKMAMGWHLTGRVSAVWGTHTHVPTADGRVLDKTTGYLSDLGMTGAYDSVIGMKKEPVIEGFQTLERTRFEVAKGDPRIAGCLFDIRPEDGHCTRVQGVFLSEEELADLA